MILDMINTLCLSGDKEWVNEEETMIFKHCKRSQLVQPLHVPGLALIRVWEVLDDYSAL